MKISVCLCNLGKYNEGELACRWLDLPATDEEIGQALDAILICHDDKTYTDCFGCPYEEMFICDYESDLGIEIGEYTPLSSLNELAQLVRNYDDEEQEVFSALVNQAGHNWLEAAKVISEHDYRYYEADNEYELAVKDLDETGDILQLPEWARNYFDYESYGEMLTDDPDCYATDKGYLFLY